MTNDRKVVAFPRSGTPPVAVVSLAQFVAEQMARDYPDSEEGLAPDRYIGGHGEDWRQK